MITLSDAATGKEIRSFSSRHNWRIQSLSFSPDGKRVLSASQDRSLGLWDVETGKRIHRFEEHGNWITSVDFSPDGRRVVTGSGDDTAALWDATTGKRIHVFEGHTGTVNSVRFSPDGKQVISGSFDNTLALWNVDGGKRIRSFEGHEKWVTGVSFDPDGKRVASASWDGTLALWDVETGGRIRTFAGQKSPVKAVSFSPDGKRIASGSRPALTLWDVRTGKLIHTFKTVFARDVRTVAFSPDGGWIATVQDRGLSSRGGWIDLWNVVTGEKSSLHPSRPQSVCFSPDGKWLVSADQDGVTLWSLKSDEPVLELRGQSKVESVAFSPGGRRIVSGSKDMTALIWQPLLSEADSARRWAEATHSLPAIEREKRYSQLMETLTTKDYRELCRTRERILASGPACLDLLTEAFPPATVIEEDRLNALLQRLDAEESEVRSQAQTTLIGFGLRILDWVESQQVNEDLPAEARDRLELVAKALRTNGFATQELGRIRAVGILLEAQDFKRLKAYKKGDPDSCASRMARLAQGP